MTVLMRKGNGKEAVYVRVLPCGFISDKNSISYDEIYETNMKRENQEVIQGIVRELRYIKNTASKGFGTKDLSKQLEIIERSKLSIPPILRQGSFYDTEKQRILEITDRMIDRYYEPYLNLSKEQLIEFS